ncbi:MAG: hypothetical protein CVV13_11350 [Gammaproteobacteria bacterium HGW-Gammaproteobacteria-3]|nr:MAG: hypothetical protein CVV13_11350 [Gammaproteobacteria bacterium HGW-Gammaproteobacteria-3]
MKRNCTSQYRPSFKQSEFFLVSPIWPVAGASVAALKALPDKIGSFANTQISTALLYRCAFFSWRQFFRTMISTDHAGWLKSTAPDLFNHDNDCRYGGFANNKK